MGCETDSDTDSYTESQLIRVRKSTYNKLSELKGEKDSFEKVMHKMIPIYINRIITESELRYNVKKEITEILLRYLEKET